MFGMPVLKAGDKVLQDIRRRHDIQLGRDLPAPSRRQPFSHWGVR
jgi:hypothetical protein